MGCQLDGDRFRFLSGEFSRSAVAASALAKSARSYATMAKSAPRRMKSRSNFMDGGGAFCERRKKKISTPTYFCGDRG